MPVHEKIRIDCSVPLFHTAHHWIRSGLVSLMLFLLFWEWFRPLIALSQWTDIYRIEPFLIAFACFLIVDYVRCPEWFGWLLKIITCLSIVCYFFDQSLLFLSPWWQPYIDLTIQDSHRLFTGHFLEISPENRTFLFLLGCSFIIYAVRSIVLSRQAAGWFVVATMVYLLMLQYLAGVNTTFGIVRTFGIGLLLISLLNGIAKKSFVWLIVSTIVIGASVATGIHFSKMKEVTVKPIAWNLLGQSNWFSSLFPVNIPAWVNPLGTSGYSEDDSRLGGQVVQNDEIVFTATTDTLTYWRGESKNYYTGQGWTQTSSQPEKFNTNPAISHSDSIEIEQEIWLSQPHSIILAGGSITRFVSLTSEDGETVHPDHVIYDQQSGKYSISNNQSLSHYKLNVSLSHKSQQVISTTSYLQLPNTLPARVRTLALQVVENEKDPYLQAKKVESFLKNEYEYSLDKPKFPDRSKDFVDHFLFEQKFGYCDHFSTAMVVMLRSLDIPARWVKGFSTGDVQEIMTDHVEGQTSAIYKIEVKNKHAHSWVEAYFPDRGWVSFEPTPGISNADQVAQIAQDEGNRKAFHIHSLWLGRTLWENIVLAFTAFSLIVLFIVLWWVRKKRNGSWRPMRGNTTDGYPKRTDAVDQIFERFWMRIFVQFGDMKPNQTIREYIQQLESLHDQQREALQTFAEMYESIRYNRPNRPWISRETLHQLFKKIVT